MDHARKAFAPAHVPERTSRSRVLIIDTRLHLRLF